MRPRKNGPLFWFSGTRTYGLEHLLYLGHRLSGLALIGYLLLHIFITAARLGGEAAWEARMTLFDNPLFHTFEYLIFAAFAFHAANGLRLIINELGLGLGRPQRPVYPYRTCLSRARRLAAGLILAACVLAGLGALDLVIWR